MNNSTRALFLSFCSTVALLSGVSAEGAGIQQFNVDPTVQQTLEQKQQESSAFLNSINIIGVDEQKGEKLGLGVGTTIAGRTNTDTKDRVTSDPTSLEAHPYECFQTNFDTHLKYAKLDAWAKFPNFQTLIRDAIIKRQALDRIMIGWNGVQAAAETDRETYPLLEDVNIGWLQHIRTNAPARHLAEVVVDSDEVRVGPNGDYQNLDSLVYDAKQLLDPWAKEDSELVVILGSQLLHDKYFPLVDQQEAPTEKLAADIVISQKRVGGLRAVTVPFFPENALLITRLDNLSIYYQNGKRRRHIKDKPERNRIENYESSNDAYVVEDYGYTAFVENIVVGNWPAPDPEA